MKCSGCGGQIPDNSAFCPFCGTPLAQNPGQPADLVRGMQGAPAPHDSWTSYSGMPCPCNPYDATLVGSPAPQGATPPPAQNRKGRAPLVAAIVSLAVSLVAVALVVLLVVVPKVSEGSTPAEEERLEQGDDAGDKDEADERDDAGDKDDADRADDKGDADDRDDLIPNGGLASADEIATELTDSFVPVTENSFDIERVRDWGLVVLDLMPPAVTDTFELYGYTKDDIADALAGSFISADIGAYAEMFEIVDARFEFYVSGDMSQDDLDLVSLDLAAFGADAEITDGKWVGMRATGSFGGEEMSEETDVIGYCAIELDGSWYFWSTSVDDDGVAIEMPEDVSVS